MQDTAAQPVSEYVPPFDRAALLAYLAEASIDQTTHDHAAVFRVEEGLELKAGMPGAHTKNLFLKDKKGQLWLISAKQDTAIDLKKAHKVMGADRLSFANEALLWECLGVKPGSVTALGLINDRDRRVNFILDRALWEADTVNFHPLENTGTTALRQMDFRRFVESLGRSHFVIDFATLERIETR